MIPFRSRAALISSFTLAFAAHASEADRQRKLYKNPSPLFAAMSVAASCATSLIENVYSYESLVAGATFLHEILQGMQASPESQITTMKEIRARCQTATGAVDITDEEIPEAMIGIELPRRLDASPFKEKLVNLVQANLYRNARCTQHTYSIEAGLLFGLQLGYGNAECRTPYGRRFLLRGPLFSVHVGSMGGALMRESSEIFVPIRNNSTFTVNRSLYGGAGFVAKGLHFEGIKARKKLNSDKVTINNGEAAYGLGLYSFYKGKTYNWCKKTEIRPNFVPLFEFFGIPIPAQ